MKGYKVTIYRTEKYRFDLEAKDYAHLQTLIAQLPIFDERALDHVFLPGDPVASYISHTEAELEWEEE